MKKETTSQKEILKAEDICASHNLKENDTNFTSQEKITIENCNNGVRVAMER